MFAEVPIQELVAALVAADHELPPGASDAQLMGAGEVDEIVACDRLERFAAARRLAATARLDARRRRAADAMVDDVAVAKSVIVEVAMARQMSASGAQTMYGFALGLVDHPRTAAVLQAGTISERVAKAVVDQTWPLPAAGRRWVDASLAATLGTLTAIRAAEAAARLVQTYDPHAAHTRATAARRHRHVRAHARPDVMGDLTIHATATQITAAYHALEKVARGAKADGDDRTITQIMADTAIERLTGQTRAGDVPVEVNIVIRPETLFGDENTPALLAGYGPIPAETARELTANSRVWVRRLFTDPADHLFARDSRRRRFDGPLGKLIRAADQHCQRPWCDCTIRDIDHVSRHADGGATTTHNGQGLCRRSHTTRHLPGWQVVKSDETDPTTWVTPTAHTYTSPHRHPLGHGPQPISVNARHNPSVAERHLRTLIGRHRQ